MRKIVHLLIAASFASCNLNTPPNDHIPGRLDSIKVGRDTTAVSKEMKGLYRQHLSNFKSCDGKIRYVIKNPQELDSLYKHILPNAYMDQDIYAELSLQPDPDDPSRATVRRVNKAEQKNHLNSCTFSEYWIFGTEPFWTIQISKEEDLIDFYDPMQQNTIHFSYLKPTIKAGVTYFETTNAGSRISIAIRKEKCNEAIDTSYNFSAKVNVNGRELNGCANSYYKVRVSDAQF